MIKTQYNKILTLMFRYPRKEWWYPPDFMRADLGDLFVGYEASARLSELARKCPNLIETRKHPDAPKYLQRKICWDKPIPRHEVPAELVDMFTAGRRAVLGTLV